MKALFIGGTGTISMGIVRRLAAETDWEVWLLNRGNRKAEVPAGVRQITADISDEADTAECTYPGDQGYMGRLYQQRGSSLGNHRRSGWIKRS